MRIVEYKGSPIEWNNFVIANSSPASFLQSWEWGEFNRVCLGQKIVRRAFMDDEGNMLAVVSGIKKNLPLGGFFDYYPRGLILNKLKKARWAEILSLALKDLKSRPRGSAFVRINPPYEFVEYKDGFVGRLGMIKPKILAHLKEPGKTLVLDLKLRLEDLLQQMHKKTRYNIKFALKKGVQIKVRNQQSATKDSIDTFYNLTLETASRDKIKIYSRDYYQKFMDYFIKGEAKDFRAMSVRQYVAEYRNRPLSVSLVVYFGDTATYLFGASSNEQRNLMPNHAIQWQAVQDAKLEGMRYYDFWGISDSIPGWAGITRFKRSFGGQVIRYIGTWDLVLDKKRYYLLWLLKLARNLFRLR